MSYAGVLVFQETKHVSGRIGELCGSEHVVLIGYRSNFSCNSESFCVERCSVSHYCSNFSLDGIQRARPENRTLFLIFPSHW